MSRTIKYSRIKFKYSSEEKVPQNCIEVQHLSKCNLSHSTTGFLYYSLHHCHSESEYYVFIYSVTLRLIIAVHKV